MLQGQLKQFVGCILQVGNLCRFFQLLFADLPVKAVRADDPPVPVHPGYGDHIHVKRIIRTDSTGDIIAHGMAGRLLFRQHAATNHISHHRMVRGHLFQLTVTDQVSAAVADLADDHFFPCCPEDRQRGPHSCQGSIFLLLFPDLIVYFLYRLFQQLHGRFLSFRFPEKSVTKSGRSDLPAVMAAHAVRNTEQDFSKDHGVLVVLPDASDIRTPGIADLTVFCHGGFRLCL